MVGNPGVHPGYPGSIPEQGAKVSLQDRSLLSFQDHDHVFFSCCGWKRHYLIVFYGRMTLPCVSEPPLLYRPLSSTIISPLRSSLLYHPLSSTVLSPLPSSLLYRPLSSPRSCLAVLVIVPRAANVTEVQLSSEQQ